VASYQKSFNLSFTYSVSKEPVILSQGEKKRVFRGGNLPNHLIVNTAVINLRPRRGFSITRRNARRGKL
jgi:hypothetical protein